VPLYNPSTSGVSSVVTIPNAQPSLSTLSNSQGSLYIDETTKIPYVLLKDSSGNGFYGALGQVFSTTYDPATFHVGGTNKFWTDFGNTTYLLDGSSNPVTNGVGVQFAKDPNGGATIFSQATAGSRPLYTTAAGTRGAVQWSAGKVMTWLTQNALNSQTKISFGAVFKRGGTGVMGFCSCDIASGANTRFQTAILSTGECYISAAPSSVGTVVTKQTAQQIDATNINAVLYSWDISAGTITVDLNGTSTSLTATTFTAAGTQDNVNFINGVSCNGQNLICFDMFMYGAHLMTTAEKVAWFAAVKARGFGTMAY
jgi:hypothetical protein